MRYIWNMYHDYRNSAGRVAQLMMPPLTHYLRMWDVTSAARVDSLLQTLQRLRGAFTDIMERLPSSFTHRRRPVRFDRRVLRVADYLFDAGELVSYKRPDLAVLLTK